ncbi:MULTISPECIES: carboxypeptidase M32 [Exiguobacterium]|uniref:Metal-dependent carboxypeptidase n=1 Tax=Exiguobacterium antarcticum TaxID=132920 RepID=A0ABT6R3E4_9BACL|nr:MULTISPECIES: carboxypeptidase M32 [Exiguobacterium]AFS70627.1 Carboxypeptidase Taq (M32) metallopeptidase [Exiguobacterium antarcticum B7]MCT4779976.1 carboxypeptidase M32 [Exiguobacterium soli]MDI3235472.1 carboxypeptidase M32 [Exiguobacterium antarcticum]
MNTLQQWRDHFESLRAYEEAVALLYWDMRTYMPEQSAENRSKSIGFLSTESFRRRTGTVYQSLLEAMGQETLTGLEAVSYEKAKQAYDRDSKIPEAEYQTFITLISEAESVWEKAKDADDWELFAPYLEKIVAMERKFVEYWGYAQHPYDALLHDYEPGMTVAELDPLFAELRQAIITLLKQLDGKTFPTLDWSADRDTQIQLNHEWLNDIGYDFTAGRLDETVHPFQTTINRKDARVTTKYDEADYRNSVFGTMHEAGHATYEQGIAPELDTLGLGEGASMGIHESQSLFFENFIGRNQGFLAARYAGLQQAISSLKDVPFETFYAAVNEVKPSLIRIEADELTYALHIIIRYELEKRLITGELEVKNLPAEWNRLYKEYLGVDVPSNAKGVLQDVHWSGGSFGYFPSYALGLVYSAQLNEALRRDVANVDQLIADGTLAPIKEWLNLNIHQYGKAKTPAELIQAATGQAISVQPLIHYLTAKYTRVVEAL